MLERMLIGKGEQTELSGADNIILKNNFFQAIKIVREVVKTRHAFNAGDLLIYLYVFFVE